MADIWPVYDGREPTLGGPWASVSLDKAIAMLRLKPKHFVSDYRHTPRFGPRDRDLSIFGYKHIVVEVHPDEARPPAWKAGYYRAPVTPSKAINEILRDALAPILGEKNIVRVEHEPSIDSESREAISVWVILAPEAPEAISNEIRRDAVSCLHEVMNTIGLSGIPLLFLATEAELAEMSK